MNYTQHIKPALLALIPVLMGLGQIIKNWLFGESSTDGKVRRTFLKVFKTSKHIPYLIWLLSFILATAWGFVTSTFTGWRMVVDAVLFTGFIQGSLVGFCAMGVFDTAKKKEG